MLARHISVAARWAALFVLVVGSVAAQAKSSGDDATVQPRIVNGVLTHGFASTGMLVTPRNPSQAALLCSGTLIGCSTFLTAAHCVEGSLNPNLYGVFLQHAGFFNVSSIAVHPSYDFPYADLAVLTLSQPVTGIAPTPINTVAKPSHGSTGVIAGFGRTSGANDEAGLKYHGNVTLGPCSAAGLPDSGFLCWQFSNPLGPAGTNSNTCEGDSGGPLFVEFAGQTYLAGVTSGGLSANCMPTDNSFDVDVHAYAAWIAQQAGADLDASTCGSMPQVGDADTVVHAASGVLNSSNRSAAIAFPVPAGTSQLRVAMNAVDDFGATDFDLYVRFGSPATTNTFDCKADGANQLGYCPFNDPTPGTWHVLVDRWSGSGRYQVTSTVFGADCSECPPPPPDGRDVAVQAARPVKLSIRAGVTVATRSFNLKVFNADPRGSGSQVVTLQADDGDCPAGTVSALAFRNAGTTVALDAGKSATARVTLSARAADFHAGGPRSPARCTAYVSASGSGDDPTPANNTIPLVIDVFDRNDY